MDHRAARQPGKAILGLLPEKLAQRGHESTARRGRPPAGAKPQQVVLKQLLDQAARATQPQERARPAIH